MLAKILIKFDRVVTQVQEEYVAHKKLQQDIQKQWFGRGSATPPMAVFLSFSASLVTLISGLLDSPGGGLSARFFLYFV